MRESLKLSLAAVMVVLLGALPAMAQTGRIGGVVKDDKGEPLKGASVVAENPSASPPSFTATTDDRGRFSIIGLRAGNWKLTASAPGFLPSEGNVPIRTIGQPNPPVEFTLAPGAAGAGGALAGVNTKELQADLAAADAMMNANDFDGAIAAYQAMLVKVPALTALHLQVGRAQRMKKDYDGALATYAKIPDGDPNAEKAQIEIGMTNLEKGDFPAADTALTEAAQGLGAGREVFYNLGEVKFAKGETDEAMKWYQRAIDVDPTWAKPYFKLGLGKLQKADMPGAIEMMEKVIAVEPTSAEAAQAKGLIDQLKKG
ncbi:MAG: carboxypeptidase regulatory-like domain-containing protein [Acidobacteria bacterium]|jgi:Flp pilus assembly protein TadD|nr:carboxypeptidase regulatory-like domain-containing protein [Acidobacteriota bacterium]